VAVTPDELRALQAPLKTRYREDPSAAVVTLRASGDLGAESVTCKVTTGRALVEAGLHPATGGTGLSACSGDMLLEALVACAGVTLRAVATALGVAIDGGTVKARFLMVGNSLRSDVLPVLDAGGAAVHIPYATTWAHEQVPVDAMAGRTFATLESIRELPAWLAARGAEDPR
jgi:hypothetical protein